MISVALFDVDGVVRHFEPPDAVEARWGLAPGTLATAAFDTELLRRLTTGRLRRRAWVETVGERIGSSDAAREWLTQPGRLDEEVLAVIGGLRASGCPVVLFSNGTDELLDELTAVDLVRHVDGVLNSAELGLAKPDPEAFLAACERVGCEPRTAAFVDDSRANVEAAAGLGLAAHHYMDVDDLRRFLTGLGLPAAVRSARRG